MERLGALRQNHIWWSECNCEFWRNIPGGMPTNQFTVYLKPLIHLLFSMDILNPIQLRESWAWHFKLRLDLAKVQSLHPCKKSLYSVATNFAIVQRESEPKRPKFVFVVAVLDSRWCDASRRNTDEVDDTIQVCSAVCANERACVCLPCLAHIVII